MLHHDLIGYAVVILVEITGGNADFFLINAINAGFALYTNSAFIMAGEEGFEPSAYGFGDRRSTS